MSQLGNKWLTFRETVDWQVGSDLIIYTQPPSNFQITKQFMIFPMGVSYPTDLVGTQHSPYFQSPHWCGNDTHAHRNEVRLTFDPGSSRSPSRGSCRWCRYWGGTRPCYVTRDRDTTRTCPGCWPVPRSCSGPSQLDPLDYQGYTPASTPLSCCSPTLAPGHL